MKTFRGVSNGKGKRHLVRREVYGKGAAMSKEDVIANTNKSVKIEVKEAAKFSDGEEYIVLKITL